MRQEGLEAAPRHAVPERPWETGLLAFNWAKLVKFLALETFQLQVPGALWDRAARRALRPSKMPAAEGSHDQSGSATLQAL